MVHAVLIAVMLTNVVYQYVCVPQSLPPQQSVEGAYPLTVFPSVLLKDLPPVDSREEVLVSLHHG